MFDRLALLAARPFPAGLTARPAPAAPLPRDEHTATGLPGEDALPSPYPTTQERVVREGILKGQEARFLAPLLAPDARAVVADIAVLGADRVDIWHGSRFVLTGDKGALYRQWTARGTAADARRGTGKLATGKLSTGKLGTGKLTAHRATTSTPNTGKLQAPVFRLPLGFREASVLVGKTANGDTWVQLERHADPTASVNIGPLGWSPHNEKRPIPLTYTS
jgi:hypothetical protein